MLNLKKIPDIALKQVKCLIVGGSSGAFTLISDMVTPMGRDFPIPMLVVLHRGRQYVSNLRELLQAKTSAVVKEAADKDLVEPGKIFLAPADFHLLVEPNMTLTLDYSEPIMYSRPSIDMSFYSAADVFGKNLAAVILSGANHDGAAGARYIENKGGIIIVQDPAEAEIKAMPKATINHIKHPIVLSNKELPEFIAAFHA